MISEKAYKRVCTAIGEKLIENYSAITKLPTDKALIDFWAKHKFHDKQGNLINGDMQMAGEIMAECYASQKKISKLAALFELCSQSGIEWETEDEVYETLTPEGQEEYDIAKSYSDQFVYVDEIN